MLYQVSKTTINRRTFSAFATYNNIPRVSLLKSNASEYELGFDDMEEGKTGGSLDRGGNGCRNLKEVYRSRRGGYDGRATVPMLWDVERKDVVCNESYDIIRLFNSGLNEVAENPESDLAPQNLEERIDEWNRIKCTHCVVV